jgi:hypothetical protein
MKGAGTYVSSIQGEQPGGFKYRPRYVGLGEALAGIIAGILATGADSSDNMGVYMLAEAGNGIDKAWSLGRSRARKPFRNTIDHALFERRTRHGGHSRWKRGLVNARLFFGSLGQ